MAKTIETQKQIDHLVYKLYGLPPSSFDFAQDYGWASTSGEIAIVEGRG